jgi:hypothetical protein
MADPVHGSIKVILIDMECYFCQKYYYFLLDNNIFMRDYLA